MKAIHVGIALLQLASGAMAQSGAQSNIREYPVPTSASLPSFIVKGPDGALWFTEYGASKIGRVSTTGVITEYRLPPHSTGPQFITVGPDGALWFTEYANKIGRITTAGVITEYTVPGDYLEGITAGPDGALWFTELEDNANRGLPTSQAASAYYST